jgi:hypothetical protein
MQAGKGAAHAALEPYRDELYELWIVQDLQLSQVMGHMKTKYRFNGRLVALPSRTTFRQS